MASSNLDSEPSSPSTIVNIETKTLTTNSDPQDPTEIVTETYPSNSSNPQFSGGSGLGGTGTGGAVPVKRRHPARLKKSLSSKPKEECKHPIVITDLCAVCGIDLRKLEDKAKPSGASVSMIHTVPDLRVSMKEAQEISKIEENRLIKQRKLHLLVDLDQTLIHTTNDRNIPNNLKDVFNFRLAGSPLTYYTRLRPGLSNFLEKISQLYELHICTFGSRNYAHSIARHLDPDGKYFYIRILSRDECFNQNSKTANLQELFPNGDHMVCIIDDREDVWNYCANLIHVKPYHFFARTGDINAPPGYAKKDDDNKVGFEFSEGKAKLVAPQDDLKPEEPSEQELQEVVEAEADSTTVEVEVEEETTKDQETIPQSGGSRSTKPSASPAQSQDSNESPSCVSLSGEIADSESVSDDPVPTSPTSQGHKGDNKSDENENVTLTEGEGSKENVGKDPELEDAHAKINADQPKEKDSGIRVEDKEKDVQKQVPSSSTTLISQPQSEDVVNDTDDYLLYLEDILTRVHSEYYEEYDGMASKDTLPHVRDVVPAVRRKVLKGVSIVFSGVIPMGSPLETSRANAVATAFGAKVSDKIIPPPQNMQEGSVSSHSTSTTPVPPTTHVVAARLGTAKTNEARRYKGIHIVTPDWLWCCAERWEHVDEKLFQLRKKSKIRRQPPGHIVNESPNENSEGGGGGGDGQIESDDNLFLEDGEDQPSTSTGVPRQPPQPGSRRIRTLSGRFMDTINPLLSFSMDEIADMDHEVDDICGLSGSSSSDENNEPPAKRERVLRRKKSRNSISSHHEFIDNEIEERGTSKKTSGGGDSSSDSSDDEATTSASSEVLRARKRRRLLMPPKTETEPEEEESLITKFRRGEPLPSDADMLNLTNQSSDDDGNGDDDEDNDWMVEALEKELLGGDDNSQSLDGY